MSNLHTGQCLTRATLSTKRQKRAQLGVYLGPSPNHSRMVHLILNPRMGHVSPQYHVKHDDFFETITNKNSNFDLPEPTWKRLSGFMKNDHKKSSDSEGAMSPAPINNTTKLNDLSDINIRGRQALIIREKPAQIMCTINKKQCSMTQRERLLQT